MLEQTERSKMAPRRPQSASREPQEGPRRPQDCPRWPKMAPRWPQDCPRCPKMVQDGPESARAHAHCWRGLLGPSWTMLGRSAAEMALDGESLLTSNKKRVGCQLVSPRRCPKHARAHAHPWRHLCPRQRLQGPAKRPLQAQGEGVRGRGKPFPEGEERG